MRSETILRAYAAISDKTPLRSDCGALCGAACCAADGDGQGGVALLPGEEGVSRPWGTIGRDPQMDAPMLICDGMCPLTRAGLRGLDPEFVRGCARAVRILAEEPDGEDFLTRWAQIEAAFRQPLF